MDHTHIVHYHRRQKVVKAIILVLVLLCGLVLFFSPTKVYSQESEGGKPADVCQVFGAGSCLGGTTDYEGRDANSIVSGLTVSIVNFLIFLGVALSVFFIVLGGYKMITANGNDKSVEDGRKMLIYAVLGLIVTLISYTVVVVVTNIISTVDISSDS
jgi:hypothetical protein